MFSSSLRTVAAILKSAWAPSYYIVSLKKIEGSNWVCYNIISMAPHKYPRLQYVDLVLTFQNGGPVVNWPELSAFVRT